MKLGLHLRLLISMLITGLAYGSLYHYIIMPLLHGELIHCISSGIIFSLINYFIIIRIYKRFYELQKVNKTLKKSINVDKLTTLYNRRAFDDDILKLSKYETYSLIFVDIDNFRRFNNEFGHKSGDIILHKVSQIIKNNIRDSDKAYRYGGEEIVILLKDCDKIKAFEIAEKIRKNISKFDNSPLPSTTISLGVANYPEDGTNFSDIVEYSDKALLFAKRSGKNCTITYNSTLSF